MYLANALRNVATAATQIMGQSGAGNPVRLSTGETIYAITEDRWEAMAKVVGEGFLNQALGRVVLFYLTPKDAAKVTPGVTLTFKGVVFTASPASEETDGNVQSVVTLTGHSIGDLWPHQCSVYGQHTGISTVTGEVQAPVYYLKATGVACFYNYTDNVDDPTDIGRLKRASFFTRDSISMTYDAAIGNADYLINTTVRPDGTAVRSFGEIHKVQGSPKLTHPTNFLPFGHLTVQAMTDENPPAELVTIAKALPHTGQSYWDLLASG